LCPKKEERLAEIEVEQKNLGKKKNREAPLYHPSMGKVN